MVQSIQVAPGEQVLDDSQVWRSAMRDWVEEPRLVVRGLEVAAMAFPSQDLRRWPRTIYRFHTLLHLFGNPSGHRDWGVYTRDISIWGLGFVSRQGIPVGRDGWVLLPQCSGKSRRIEGTVIRCRDFLNGWYEGAVLFAQEQPVFSPERIDCEDAQENPTGEDVPPPEHFLG